MFQINENNQVFLYPGVMDFRLGIYGLRKVIGEAALVGGIYIFANKFLTSIKVIEIEKNAVWLYQKKLFKGKFSFPKTGDLTRLSKEEINYIIEGVSLIIKIETKNQITDRKFY